jgi:hypothetical protein
MKKIIIILSVLALFITLKSNAFAQCDPDKKVETCISSLKEGFTFLKSYKVDGDGGGKSKVEYSYVFSKDATYYINICNDGGETDGIIVTLYDSNRRPVTTSFANGKYFNQIMYPCNATGIYYITYTFQNSKNHCGGSVLGFKR